MKDWVTFVGGNVGPSYLGKTKGVNGKFDVKLKNFESKNKVIKNFGG